MEDNKVSLEAPYDNKAEDTSNDSEVKEKKEQPLRGVKRRKKYKKRRKKVKDSNNKSLQKKQRKNSNPNYVHKKKRGKNSPYYKSDRYIERSALAIFNEDTTSSTDLSYICDDETLLKRHLLFISRCPPHTVGLSYDRSVKYKVFSDLKRYRDISDRFYFLIEICYNKNHRLYPYFGGKGIRLSEEFLDAKKFCAWCLKNRLVYPNDTYKTYLQRIDKTKNFSPDNCCVISEKDVHENKYLNITLAKLLLQKKYSESHADKVNYMIAYSRYFQYDMEIDDALQMPRKYKSPLYDFSPINFYKSVSDEKSCTLTVYLSRYKTLHDGGVPIDPYSFLDKDASVVAIAKRYGVSTEKLERHKANNENREKRTNDIYKFFEDKAKELYNFDLNSPENSVYNNYNSNDVYSH